MPGTVLNIYMDDFTYRLAQQSYEVVTLITIPILQMRTLKKWKLHNLSKIPQKWNNQD